MTARQRALNVSHLGRRLPVAGWLEHAATTVRSYHTLVTLRHNAVQMS
jgi:hypothetical protein